MSNPDGSYKPQKRLGIPYMGRNKRPKMTPEEQRKHQKQASDVYRRRLREKGLRPVQFYVPDEIREQIKEVVREILVTYYETIDGVSPINKEQTP